MKVCCRCHDLLSLEFDHLYDKEFSISTASFNGLSVDRINKEIEKCEIVCSNCHKIRTHNRRNTG